MALTIAGTTISNDQTARTTGLAHARAGNAGQVTWLPVRLMDCSADITAMVLADPLGGTDLQGRRHLRQHVDDYAAELGQTGPDATVRAPAPPSEQARQGETDPEAGA